MRTFESTKRSLSTFYYAAGTLVGIEAARLILNLLPPDYSPDCGKPGVVACANLSQYSLGAVADYGIAIVVSLAVLILTNWLISRWEKNQNPKISDHFRQCILHYVALVGIILASILAASLHLGDASTGYSGWLWLVFLYIFVAIFVNVIWLTLISKTKKSDL